METLFVEFLWQDSFQIRTTPLSKSKRMGKYLWKMMKMIIRNSKASIFQTVDTQHVFILCLGHNRLKLPEALSLNLRVVSYCIELGLDF